APGRRRVHRFRRVERLPVRRRHRRLVASILLAGSAGWRPALFFCPGVPRPRGLRGRRAAPRPRRSPGGKLAERASGGSSLGAAALLGLLALLEIVIQREARAVRAL